ncbi:hypothetical protein An11g07990 [Aspergillus niger]|uniref:Uncharacterized protein n=2 Tax=Aspergillus niger TaxID=5061 RepID=A2QX84_ASPNC|nr:hypothetical protein An11g07990 [Aspergillus niger]CAK45992.1 hypothetical protein An11g07990 [Aspergillus niger]
MQAGLPARSLYRWVAPRDGSSRRGSGTMTPEETRRGAQYDFCDDRDSQPRTFTSTSTAPRDVWGKQSEAGSLREVKLRMTMREGEAQGRRDAQAAKRSDESQAEQEDEREGRGAGRKNARPVVKGLAEWNEIVAPGVRGEAVDATRQDKPSRREADGMESSTAEETH